MSGSAAGAGAGATTVSLAALASAPPGRLLPGRLAAHNHAGLLTLVEEVGGGGRGRGLVAAAAIPAGTLLLRETAICWQAEGAAEGEGMTYAAGEAPPAVDAFLLQLVPFSLTPEALTRVRMRAVPRAEAVAAVLKANSYAVKGSGGGGGGSTLEARALFPVISLINHSCDPCCTVQQEAGGEGGGTAAGAPCRLTAGSPPVYTVRARRDIAAGEEVTVAYLPRVWPLHDRQAYLVSLWSFDCACTRCSRGYDDCAVARCRACATGRVYLGAPACVDCGAPSTLTAAETAALADPAVLLPLTETAATAAAMVDGLIAHPLLAVEDARVFTNLTSFMGSLLSDEFSESAEEIELLYSRIAQAIALASLRTAFVSPADLGVEVEVEEGEAGEGEE
jgi:hypothetical protein